MLLLIHKQEHIKHNAYRIGQGTMINKSTYTKVASIINKRLSILDDGDYKPRVSVVNTQTMGYGFDKYSLATNNELTALTDKPSMAQDMFFADETYVVGDDDLYIEPVMHRYFSLAIA